MFGNSDDRAMWDDDELPGRIRTVSEFLAVMASRPDLFEIDHEHRMRYLTLLAMLTAAGVGTLLNRVVPSLDEPTDAFGPNIGQPAIAGTLLPGTFDRTPRPRVEPPAPSQPTPRRTVQAPRNTNGPEGRTHAGNPLAHLTNRGVLFYAERAITGHSLPGTDFAGLGGFADRIDLSLGGNQGIARGGVPGAGRRGATSIGFGNTGDAGGEPNDVMDLINDLMNPGPAARMTVRPPREPIKIIPPDSRTQIIRGTSGRSRSEITSVVYANLPALRHAYSTRLRLKPELGGRITVKFLIDESGKIFDAEVLSSDIGDAEFERIILDKVRLWRFERIDKPGDVTEVVYPFVFSR